MHASMCLKIQFDTQPFLATLDSLAEVGKRFPEVVDAFLDGSNSLAQIGCIDRDDLTASIAGEFRIVLQPSNRLVDFLAARAGDGEDV